MVTDRLELARQHAAAYRQWRRDLLAMQERVTAHEVARRQVELQCLALQDAREAEDERHRRYGVAYWRMSYPVAAAGIHSAMLRR